jgi:hypothetical protein
MNQKPTVGRVVHYYKRHMSPARDDSPYAALIVEVIGDDRVTLRVFSKIKPSLDENVRASYSEEPAIGCWSWPPRS